MINFDFSGGWHVLPVDTHNPSIKTLLLLYLTTRTQSTVLYACISLGWTITARWLLDPKMGKCH